MCTLVHVHFITLSNITLPGLLTNLDNFVHPDEKPIN